MLSFDVVSYAFVGGLLPALVWLYFLLKEEDRCPQPRWVIFTTFVAGMLAVPCVLPLEEFVVHALPSGLSMIIAWAAIEETCKYLAASLIIYFCRGAIRNSIDLVIIMLTVALGFAALENGLFLLGPLGEGQFLSGFITNNLRFVGSTLLHVIASSAIGFALAFTFTAPRLWRALFASVGLILAIALHALFNFFIINGGGSQAIFAFFTVWTSAIVFFAVFEVLKYIRYHNLPKNTC